MVELTALSSRLVEQLQHFKLLCLTRQRSEVFKKWREVLGYIYFVDNLFLFSTAKKFSKSGNEW